jgi:hypothetical protein
MILPLQHLAGIHRMNCLLGRRFALTGSIGKIEPRQLPSVVGQSHDSWVLHAGVNLSFTDP